MLRRFLIRRAIRRMNKVNFSRVTNGWLTHDGRERTYALYTPPQPSASMPLLIALHGGGGRGSGMIHITYGGFNRLAERETFVVVYPDGVDKRWNDGRGLTEWRAHRERVDDVGFIAALIDQISAEQPIDRRRVYVTGISNGGMMSYRLACELGDRIAAIAPVVAALPAHLSGCVPPHAMPIILMNGTDDPLIPYQGGPTTPLPSGWRAMAAARRRCAPTFSTPTRTMASSFAGRSTAAAIRARKSRSTAYRVAGIPGRAGCNTSLRPSSAPPAATSTPAR